MNKNSKVLIGLLAAAVVLAAGWYLVSPLFITNSVDEAFPFEIPDEAALASMDDEEMAALEADFITAVPNEEAMGQLSEGEQAIVAEQVLEAAAAVMSDKEIADEMPAEEAWVSIGSGMFVGADNFHEGSGTAVILQQGDQRVLRLEDFSVTNGPDLHVILSKNPTPTNRDDIGNDSIDLGSLKGNMGNQNYEIPADVDLSDYQSVVIYCVPFHVQFASATLDN